MKSNRPARSFGFLVDGNGYSKARAEFDNFDKDPSSVVRASLGHCFAKAMRYAGAPCTEADVKRYDDGDFRSSDPCLAIVGPVGMAYCADTDAVGVVKRVVILAVFRTTTGRPPIDASWRKEVAQRYRSHRRNPLP